MADIYQIHFEMGASMALLRRMDRAGYLRVTKPESVEGGKLATALRRRQNLNAGHLVMLFKDPTFAARAGRFESAALAQLDALGNIAGESAPLEVATHLIFCATKEPESVDIVAGWLRQHMDSSPAYAAGVTYVHVAVRLMANLPDSMLSQNIKNCSAAVLVIRKHKLLTGYSHVNADGKTIFQKPELPLDL